MTEGSESLKDKAAFFDRILEENIRLFSAGSAVSEDQLSHIPVTDLVQSSDVIETSNQNNLSDTSDASPNRSRRRLRLLATVGGVAIVCAGVLAGLSKSNNSPNQRTTPGGMSVRLNGLPKRLPVAVEADLNNTGRVDVEIYASESTAVTSDDYKTEEWASAVEINPNLVLTAGHLMSSRYDQLGSRNECQQVTFTNSIERDFFVNEYGTTSTNPVPGIPDLEILTLPQSSDYEPTYDSSRDITIAPKPPQVGEELFFVNDEPEISGTKSVNYGFAGPAIYIGVYEGKTSYGDYDVITDLRSYGQISNTSSIGGSSGGAVLNAKGQLVGISVRASTNTSNNSQVSSSSVEQYEKWDGVKFEGLKSNSQLTDSIVQPVTTSLVNRYIDKDNAIAQNCFPKGGEQ